MGKLSLDTLGLTGHIGASNTNDPNGEGIMAKRTFEQWMAQVNRKLMTMCMMSADEIPDWGYYDAYAEGVPPFTAARRAIAASGGF